MQAFAREPLSRGQLELEADSGRIYGMFHQINASNLILFEEIPKSVVMTPVTNMARSLAATLIAMLTALIVAMQLPLIGLVRPLRQLAAMAEAVGRGESLLDPAVTGKVLERMRRIASSDQPDELGALTPQERKILALVAEGKTNKEIATDVFLSDKTVKNYVSSILAKLNLERRAQAAAYVARLKTHSSD